MSLRRDLPSRLARPGLLLAGALLWPGLARAAEPAPTAAPASEEAAKTSAAAVPVLDDGPADEGDDDTTAAGAPVVPATPNGKEAETPAGGDACIDENVRADLLAKRQRRSARDRLFQKTNRHELGAYGGYYVSDLFDRSFITGGSYAYHMTEDLSIEATGSYTRLTSSAAAGLERNFAVLQNKSRTAWMAEADLVWVPAYAKLRAGGSIVHFDLYLEGGAGIIDSALSNDIAANGGFGIKMFLGRATAVRFDVRDRFYRQQLLSRVLWVNDISTTLGLSLFLPLGE